MRGLLKRGTRWLNGVIDWRLLVAWMALIFALSSIPNNFAESDSAIPAGKIAHGIEFAVLALILAWLARQRGYRRAIAFAAAVVLSTLYGVTDEVHQRFVPGRDVSRPDLAADVIGAIAGASMAIVVASRELVRRRTN